MILYFSLPYLFIQPSQESPLTLPLLKPIFSFLFHLLQQTTPTTFTNTLFLYTSTIFCLSIFMPLYLDHFLSLYIYIQPFLQFLPKMLSSTLTIQSVEAGTRVQWASESCVNWYCFHLSLFPRSMDRDNSAHSHWFLIT